CPGCPTNLSSNLVLFPFQLEDKNTVEDVIAHFLDTVTREDLQLLLTEDGAWETFVAETGLSRDEAGALQEDLKELTTDMAIEEKDVPQEDLQQCKRFLSEFPRVKADLEERIEKLRALADKIDKVHRDCTISNLVTNTAGALSGILSILGLALAPVTAGTSLALSATGMGLGAVAAATGVSTSIVEHVNMVSANAEASRLMATRCAEEQVVTDVKESTLRVLSLANHFKEVLEGMEKNINAISLAKANPRLVAKAKRFMTSGRISAQSSRQVQKAFGGTALAMARGARIIGAATTGVFLMMDVVSLMKDSIHLHDGAKTESAEEMRKQAQEMEKKLVVLTCIHGLLQVGLTQ
ncbi:Apolipoprotein L3, partial [Tupaia chinensis]